jgi:hypothetical protein
MVLAVIVGIAVTTHEAPQPAPEQSAAPAASGALELLSMRHARASDGLTVTGLVRNPAGAREVYGVMAVVYAFARDGSLVTSGRAALDEQALRPGEQASFAVRLPGNAEVARYRVTFRTDRGVVRHTDRRTDARLAAAGAAERQVP